MKDTFMPLPLACDMSNVEPVQLSEENEALFGAYEEYIKEQDAVRALKEWSVTGSNRIQRRNSKRLLKKHQARLAHAEAALHKLTHMA